MIMIIMIVAIRYNMSTIFIMIMIIYVKGHNNSDHTIIVSQRPSSDKSQKCQFVLFSTILLVLVLLIILVRALCNLINVTADLSASKCNLID